MEPSTNACIAIFVSLSVGISAVVPLAFMQDEPEVMSIPDPEPAQASHLKVSVTIERVKDIGDLEPGGKSDFYAVVTLNGIEYDEKPDLCYYNNDDDISPGWYFSSEWVDVAQGSVPVVIEIYDEDGGLRGDDDHADLQWGTGMNLDLTVALSPCAVSGDISGGCGATLVSQGGGDDAVKIWFKIEVFALEVGVRVTIKEVEELGDLDGIWSDPDFYAVVIIDGTVRENKCNVEAWEGDDHIWPDWRFTKWLDVEKRSVQVIIKIYDDDPGADFKADIKPGSGKHLTLTVTLVPCSITGTVTGHCGVTHYRQGAGDDAAKVGFKIEVDEPTYAPGMRVRCIHSPVWPQSTDAVTITVESLDGALAPRIADRIEVWVDDRTAAAQTGSITTLTHKVGAFPLASEFFYGCRIVDDGVPIFSGYRKVSVSSPSGSAAIPVLYTGPRGSSIDIVLIPDKDNYGGPGDADFISDTEDVIMTYFSEDVFLRNQDKLTFWFADKMGDGEDDCDNTAPSNWDEDYSFADAGAIVHTDYFRDCNLGGERFFSAWTGDLRVFLHESGHMPFGLADEYAPDGGYWQSDIHPNIYDELSDCLDDVSGLGREDSDCREFIEVISWWPDSDWYTSEPASNDLMNIGLGDLQAADLRKINWLFEECDSANCEVPETDSYRPIMPAGSTDPRPSGTDPRVEPVPEFDFGDINKSIVVRLDFNDRTDVDFDSAKVSLQRGHANIGDPPLLRVELSDDTGSFIGNVNAWHPLWAFRQNYDGTHSLIILPSASGRFVIPFRDDYGTFQVHDVALNQELIEVDLVPVIRDFCWQSPRDPDCMANFTWSSSAEEGRPVQFTDLSQGPTGSVVSWMWNFGDGSPYVSMARNPSHVYGDNGVFTVTLTVTDSTGLVDSVKYDVVVANVAPLIDLPSVTVDENEFAVLTANVIDPGSDDVTLLWSLKDWSACDDSAVFLNDPSGPDPAYSPSVNPRDILHSPPPCQYGDNGQFFVSLTASDDDGGVSVLEATITVDNVNPTIDADTRIFAVADITLRVSGEKWHDVKLKLTEDLVETGMISVTRYPGSPDDQTATMPSQNLFLTGPTIGAIVEYTPEDDPINGQPNGANPVWIRFTMENGYEFEVQHNFNVNHPGTYVWTIDNLLDYVGLANIPLHFTATATDPGSDDLTFTWNWGDSMPSISTTYLNDPIVGPDPFPSPEVNPQTASDHQVHAFTNPGTYTIELTVKDDDNGESVVTLPITI
jgi:PKD repeat protein